MVEIDRRSQSSEVSCRTDIQAQAVEAISSAASTWLNKRASPDESIENYPNAMVWRSLDPLLRSLTGASCWALIDKEGVRGIHKRLVIGHVIASNTPLLAMTSVIRALLVGLGSIVKLPFNAPSGWFNLFLDFLRQADPEIAGLVQPFTWSRSDAKRNNWLYRNVDILVAYGDNGSLSEITAASSVPVIGYGHKTSAAVITKSAINSGFYDDLALDVLMYDQGGCLSPHTVFVEGNLDAGQRAAERLSAAMSACTLPQVQETLSRAAKVTEARSLIGMDPRAKIIKMEGSRFTVVMYNDGHLHVSPTHSIIYVVPASKEGIIEELTFASSQIQAVGLAADVSIDWEKWKSDLLSAGLSYICSPGTMQTPTIHWREDNRDLLSTLIL